MTIFFTRYDRGKSIRMLSLYHHGLIGKNKEHGVKNIWWLIIICWIKYKKKLKEITGNEKFYDTKILIETDNILPDDTTLKIWY